MDQELILNVETPLDFKVRCSKNYWENSILKKHSILKDKLEDIVKTLQSPLSIRQSKTDKKVYLFYTGEKPRWLCVVVKDQNEYGFLITAYPTSAIKEGNEIWKK